MYRPTISNRPPPAIPCTGETEPGEDEDDYATLDDFSPYDSLSWCRSTMVNMTYEYVQRRPNKGLRPSSASPVITRGRNSFCDNPYCQSGSF